MDEGAAVVELVAPGYDDGLSSADCISIKWSNQGMHSWEGWPILAWDRTLQGNHIWIADTRSASSCSTDQGLPLAPFGLVAPFPQPSSIRSQNSRTSD
jgi:hypothetical protein